MAEPGTGSRRAGTADLLAAERWFDDNGPPWFVDDARREVATRLSRPRLLPVVGVAVVVCAAAGTVVGQLSDDASAGILAAVQLALVLALGYALLALRVAPIAAWAGRRTFRSLGMLFPLATRACRCCCSS